MSRIDRTFYTETRVNPLVTLQSLFSLGEPDVVLTICEITHSIAYAEMFYSRHSFPMESK